MAANSRLKSILNVSEAEERARVLSKRSVDVVVEERADIVHHAESEYSRLSAKAKRLGHGLRFRALSSADPIQLVSVEAYRRRLANLIESSAEELKGKVQELESAQKHQRAAEAAVLDAKVERRRIETIIEQRTRTEGIREEARTEVRLDEQKPFKRGR